MVARFILSLDCEGKWGAADDLSAKEVACLTDAGLRDAYGKILALLDEFSVPATFAFVGLFGEREDSFRHMRPEVERLAERSSHYLEAALRAIDCSAEGWHGDWAIDSVGSRTTSHEIALHGVTHVPWGSVDREFAKSELSLHALLQSDVRNARTYVAPRNQVAYVDLLATIGIEGYREAPPIRTRMMSLLSEFNIWEHPQSVGKVCPSRPLPIPSGFFLNWRRGLRRLVPIEVTISRFKHMLESATPCGQIVHFWLHPENMVTAPEGLGLLRNVLAIVAGKRDRDECEILTQEAYVDTLVS